MPMQRYRLAVLVVAALSILCAATLALFSGTGILGWLKEPLDPGRSHSIDAFSSWHARCMVFAWSVLFPVGMLTARFFKIMPGQDWPRVKDNPAWWKIHLRCQWTGAGCAIVGLAIIMPYVSRTSTTAGAHRFLGWTVLTMLVLQVASGVLRGSKGGPTKPAADGSWRGDHYDMTPRRVVFEYVHKTLGYVAFLLAAATTVLGLWEVNAPRWMWGGLGCWWVLLVATFCYLQQRGMARDTYEAIWGPELDHPGNRRKPIGWGIRRSEPRTFRSE